MPSGGGTLRTLPVIDPDELIRRTYLTEPDEKGQRFRAKVVRKIEEHDDDVEKNPERIKFLVSIDGDQRDEIITYNQLLEHLEDVLDPDPDQVVWKFKEIIAHEGPLKPGDPSYKGSRYNVLMAWEDG